MFAQLFHCLFLSLVKRFSPLAGDILASPLLPGAAAAAAAAAAGAAIPGT